MARTVVAGIQRRRCARLGARKVRPTTSALRAVPEIRWEIADVGDEVDVRCLDFRLTV